MSSAALLLPAADGYAGDADRTFSASATLERHHTSNALDGIATRPDWYWVLRGAIEETLAHDLGSTRLATEFEVSRYDRHTIENDASVGFLAETTARPSENLELRGTLSASLSEEGDDLDAGVFVIGMRTPQLRLAGSLQAGLQLAPDLVLALEGTVSRERPGETRFENGIIAPLRLDPVRDRLQLAATVTRTAGVFSFGLAAATGLMQSHEFLLLPEIRLADFTVKGHGGASFANGATVKAAAGVQMLDVLGESFRQLRPTYELAVALPLPAGFALRGALAGAYDIASGDDPLAAWVQRAEAEASYRATEAISFGAGAFFERRDNVGLGYTEFAQGFYGEAIWQATGRLGLLLRADATRRFLRDVDTERRTLDIQLAVNARL